MRTESRIEYLRPKGMRMRPHNEELYIFYSLPNVVKLVKYQRLRLSGYVVWIKEGSSAFKILRGKPTGTRSLESARPRWKDNMRTDIKEVVSMSGWFDSR